MDLGDAHRDPLVAAVADQGATHPRRDRHVGLEEHPAGAQVTRRAGHGHDVELEPGANEDGQARPPGPPLCQSDPGQKSPIETHVLTVTAGSAGDKKSADLGGPAR